MRVISVLRRQRQVDPWSLVNELMSLRLGRDLSLKTRWTATHAHDVDKM